ncbi:glucose 1-dehydrogenase [Candidatus Bathyarchaeota archaeon]|nr:glucose 1-dehydrogenase [Candidatus Bathyarchaeota archaeon]
MKGLNGKRVLVTGASKGLGAAIACRFASEGCIVGINFRSDLAGAERTLADVQEVGGSGAIFQADVSNEREVDRMLDAMKADLNGLDILVNNAAIQLQGASHEIPVTLFDKVIAVNLRGPFMCAKKAIEHFLSNGINGVIINITSAHEIIPKPGFIGYATSKSGLINLTKTLALEYASKGIRVNNVAPGAILTNMNDEWRDDREKRANVESHIPLGYAATPEEIAPAVCFLASDEARYITGTTLFVDGGATLYPEYRENWSS